MLNSMPTPACLIVSGNMVEATDLADILHSERGWQSTVVQQHGDVLHMLNDEAFKPHFAVVSEDMEGMARVLSEKLVEIGTRVILLNGKADDTRMGVMVIARPFGTSDVIQALNQLF